jgi:hypothetical protein
MLDSNCMGRDMYSTDKSMMTINRPKIYIAEGKVHLIVGSIYSHNLV